MLRYLNSVSSLCFFSIAIAASTWAQVDTKTPAPANTTATQENAGNSKAYESNRKYAFELYNQNKFTEALPLLEQLAAENPKDVAVMESYGMALLASASGLSDPAKRKEIRFHSRTVLLKAQALGDNSDLLQTLLAGIPEDGATSAYSEKKEVDDAMREGEAAFSSGDLKKAITSYERAHLLDPTLYSAPLFIGDCYFKLHIPGSAGLWFAEAIRINPDVETAYRYWGDTLMGEGKMAEARTKFIESYIAQPYGKSGGAFALQKWANANHVQIGHPKIQSPNSVTQGKEKGNINITIMNVDKNDGSSAWMIYDMHRASWRGDNFAKHFPNEKNYRHTLVEEVEGLGMVANMVEEQKKKIKTLDPALATLLRLKKDGLIEAFVLLAKADNDIAQDYPAYFKDHREKLRKYVEEYVVPPLQSQNSTELKP
jgi:tetratricopeptide (TPR) repeat protein